MTNIYMYIYNNINIKVKKICLHDRIKRLLTEPLFPKKENEVQHHTSHLAMWEWRLPSCLWPTRQSHSVITWTQTSAVSEEEAAESVSPTWFLFHSALNIKSSHHTGAAHWVESIQKSLAWPMPAGCSPGLPSAPPSSERGGPPARQTQLTRRGSNPRGRRRSCSPPSRPPASLAHRQTDRHTDTENNNKQKIREESILPLHTHQP